MTDTERVIEEAREQLKRLRFATDWITQDQLDQKVDDIITAAVEKALAEQASRIREQILNAPTIKLSPDNPYLTQGEKPCQ